MSYLDEIEQLGLDGRTPSVGDILQVVRRGVAELSEWRTRIVAAFETLDGRLDLIEARLLIVDTLPADAPFGALIRLRGDTTGALYTGNGTGQPLGKLVPEAV